MKFAKLFFGNFGRGVHHDVLALAGFRICDCFAYVWFILKEHYDAVDAGGETAMRRSAISESFKHVAKLFLLFFFRDLKELENLLLLRSVVDSD